MQGHHHLIFSAIFSRLWILVLAGLMGACIGTRTEVEEEESDPSFDWNQPSAVLGNFAGIQGVSDVTNNSVVVSWADHPSASFYAVFYKLEDAEEWSLEAIIPRPETSHLVVGLLFNTRYSFMVNAIDRDGLFETNHHSLNAQTIMIPDAPESVMLKIPAASPGFSRTPTFTVRYVVPGDTIRLFKDASCTVENKIAEGVVPEEQDWIDLTVASLGSEVARYKIYANATSSMGATSACSLAFATYQAVSCLDESYAPVEANEELGTDAFCVMRTEAKKGANNIPVAQYAETPWVNIKAQSAKLACQKINMEHASCDVISNRQWLAVAKDIEITAANWSGGAVGSGTLNRGHTDSVPNSVLSISNYEDEWDQTGQTSDTWLQKRTHVLSNGAVIWDLSGNAREWVDWTTGGLEFTLGPQSCPAEYRDLFAVNCPELDPLDYLPGDPLHKTTAYTSSYGIGKLYGTTDDARSAGLGGAAQRGGRWSNNVNAGIFALVFGSGPLESDNETSFRCACVMAGDSYGDEDALAAPTTASLKNPVAASSFSSAPTFTVGEVEEGDTVGLYGDASCKDENLLGSGVVMGGQNEIDITLDPLPRYGTYHIYAKRTNASAETSPCSPRLNTYQYIGCPDESYIPVPGDPLLGTTDFCVMRTEAKYVGGKYLSQYAEKPVRTKAVNAKNGCRGQKFSFTSCDLISNRQWMTLARNIEAIPENWSGGEVGSGMLNRGHSDNSPNDVIAITDPEDPWTNTGNASSDWSQKRTHLLSNGYVIWDLSANAQEYVDWNPSGETISTGPTTCPAESMEIYDVVCPDLEPEDYLPLNPANIPEALYNSVNCNIGKVYGTSDGTFAYTNPGIAARGEAYNKGNKAGIYALSLNQNSNNYAIGFRCVCIVNGE